MMPFVSQNLENEIWNFGRNLPLATFGSDRVIDAAYAIPKRKPEKNSGRRGFEPWPLGYLGSALTNEAAILDKIKRKFRLPPLTLAIIKLMYSCKMIGQFYEIFRSTIRDWAIAADTLNHANGTRPWQK